MNKLKLYLCVLTGVFTLTSCSTFNKMAVSTSGNLLYSVGDEAQGEANYEIFKAGIAGNLMILEGLLSASPKNLNLLATLTKGYAGYAFAVNETQMYEEEWAELKSEEGKRQALFNYTRAMNFGFRYLADKNIELNDILSRINEPQGIQLLLDKKLGDDKRDLEVVLFTAQSLGGLINLQKDNMGLVSQISAVKEMFDWVCRKDPAINYGTCDIFYGAYEAGRPQMLGGNPAKGKEIFLKAIAKHPHNWLIRTSYLQFYLIPQNDEEGFKEQMAVLKTYQEYFDNQYIYRNAAAAETAWARENKLRFYQALALKRYELLNRFQKQFF
jgi:TRAP transporter T-component